MPIDVIGFAIARGAAANQGVSDQEANRLGIVASLASGNNPVMALVVARAMAQKEAPAPPVTDSPPPSGGTQGQGTGSTGNTGGTGSGSTSGSGQTGTSGGGDIPSNQVLLAHVDQARTGAEHAKASAEEAHRAVTRLSHRVDAGFRAIEEKLSGGSSTTFTTAETLDRPPRRRRGAAVEGEG